MPDFIETEPCCNVRVSQIGLDEFYGSIGQDDLRTPADGGAVQHDTGAVAHISSISHNRPGLIRA